MENKDLIGVEITATDGDEITVQLAPPTAKLSRKELEGRKEEIGAGIKTYQEEIAERQQFIKDLEAESAGIDNFLERATNIGKAVPAVEVPVGK